MRWGVYGTKKDKNEVINEFFTEIKDDTVPSVRSPTKKSCKAKKRKNDQGEQRDQIYDVRQRKNRAFGNKGMQIIAGAKKIDRKNQEPKYFVEFERCCFPVVVHFHGDPSLLLKIG